jgi:DNA-directed RNA polymerase subunit RPC12/RpoP
LDSKESKPEKTGKTAKTTTLEACPHCGTKLSMWEQVLLSVDRTLMCKNCWYRIILDVFDENDNSETKSGEK